MQYIVFYCLSAPFKTLFHPHRFELVERKLDEDAKDFLKRIETELNDVHKPEYSVQITNIQIFE